MTNDEAVKAERERCAKVAENFRYDNSESYYTYEQQHFTKDIANAIRFREEAEDGPLPTV
jgi:hypothetical protein